VYVDRRPQPHEYGLRGGEAGLAEDEIKICCFFNALLAAVTKAVHNVAFALPDAFHVDADVPGVNAVVSASTREICDASAGDHGFRWRATFVDAGSAYMLAFYHRGSKPGLRQRRAQRSSALA